MSTRTWTLVLLALGVMLMLVAACNPNPEGALTPVPTLAPGATPTLLSSLSNAPAQPLAAGAGLSAAADPGIGAHDFLENCTGCHGVRAEGTDIAPALRNDKFVVSGDAAVVKTISGGRPGTEMPAWSQAAGGSLTDEEINGIVAFLKTQQGVPQLPKATPVPEEPAATPAPGAPAEEAAKPSEPGGAGPAVGLAGVAERGMPLFGKYCAACHGPQGRLGRPNPGSDDGAAPALDPIDETIANKDAKVFATNMDLYIEHGSVPSGPSPVLAMPGFGDSKLLNPQQIADIMAYVISLNTD